MPRVTGRFADHGRWVLFRAHSFAPSMGLLEDGTETLRALSSFAISHSPATCLLGLTHDNGACLLRPACARTPRVCTLFTKYCYIQPRSLRLLPLVLNSAGSARACLVTYVGELNYMHTYRHRSMYGQLISARVCTT